MKQHNMTSVIWVVRTAIGAFKLQSPNKDGRLLDQVTSPVLSGGGPSRWE